MTQKGLVVEDKSVDVLGPLSSGASISAPTQRPDPDSTPSPTSHRAAASEAVPGGAPEPTKELPVVQQTASSLIEGLTIDERYEVRREFGKGAQGSVYLVWDRQREMEVVLKIMRETPFGRGDHGRLRFLRESSLGRRIGGNPYTTPVFDTGEYRGLPYFTMEYFPGALTLDAALRPGDRGREDGFLYTAHLHAPDSIPDLACDIISKVALGLFPLHVQGYIHRDIKPNNILVRLPNVHSPIPQHLELDLRIIDYGIARDPNSNLTGAGVIGTPCFMAPEVLSGQPYSPQSDIFALGLVFFGILTNRYPWPELLVSTENDATTLFKIQAFHRTPRSVEPIKFSDELQSIAPGFDYILARMLAHDPCARYASVVELVEDIAHIDYLANAGALPISRRTRAPVVAPLSPAPAADPVSTIRSESDSLPADDNPFAQMGVLPAPSSSPQPAPTPAPAVSATPEPSQAVKAIATSARTIESVEMSVDKPITSDTDDLEALVLEQDYQERRRTTNRLIYAGVAGLLVLVVFGGGLAFLQGLVVSPTPQDEPANAWLPPAPPEDPDEWVRDIRDAKPVITKEPASLLAGKSTGAEVPAAVVSQPPQPTPNPARTPKRNRVAKASKQVRAEPQAENDASQASNEFKVHPMFAKYVGAKPRLGGRSTLTSRSGKNGKAVNASIAGLQLQARLLDDVASAPADSPVVAALTQAATLGPHKLPAGTEIHGKTQGVQGARLFVAFQFARFAAKNRAPLHFKALARGRDGRKGIPGKRNLDAGDAGNVASVGAGDVIRDAAGALADTAGDVLGSNALRSMGNKAGDKAAGLGVEEQLVVAPRGTVFTVYFESLRPVR